MFNKINSGAIIWFEGLLWLACSLLARLWDLARFPIFVDESTFGRDVVSMERARTYADYFVSLRPGDGEPPLMMWGALLLAHVIHDPVLALRTIAALSGAAITLILFWLGREWLGTLGGRIAAGIYVLLPQALFSERLGLMDAPLSLFGLLTLAFSWRLGEKPTPARAFVTGLCVVLAALCKPIGLGFVALPVLALAVHCLTGYKAQHLDCATQIAPLHDNLHSSHNARAEYQNPQRGTQLVAYMNLIVCFLLPFAAASGLIALSGKGLVYLWIITLHSSTGHLSLSQDLANIRDHLLLQGNAMLTEMTAFPTFFCVFGIFLALGAAGQVLVSRIHKPRPDHDNTKVLAHGQSGATIYLALWYIVALLGMSAAIFGFFPPRYLLFLVPPAALLAAGGVVSLGTHVQERWSGGRLLVIACFLGGLIVTAGLSDYTLLTNPENTPLTLLDRWQYISGLPSGFGQREALAQIAHDAQKAWLTDHQPLRVFSTGNPPHDELYLTFADDQAVRLSAAKLRPGHQQSFCTSAGSGHQTLSAEILLNWPADPAPEQLPGLRRIATYPRPLATWKEHAIFILARCQNKPTGDSDRHGSRQ